MKKIIAALLSVVLLAALCAVSASAKPLSYKNYALFSEIGEMTEGVEFYIEGEEIDYDEQMLPCIGHAWNGTGECAIKGKTADGGEFFGMVIWSPGEAYVAHTRYGTAVRINTHSYVKIVFTGTAFRAQSNYWEGSFADPTVTVDGEEVDVFTEEIDTAADATFVEVEDLDWGVHTVIIQGNGDFEFDNFDVSGFLGVYEGEKVTELDDPEPDTSETEEETEAPDTKKTDDPATEEKKNTAANTEPTVSATEENGVNLGLIIGIAAAVIVIIAVVIIIVKKKN